MNFQGLGFSFTSVDKGVRSTLNAIQSGFSRAGEAVTSFSQVAKSGLGRMGDLLRPIMPESMEGATEKVTGFFGAMKDGLVDGVKGVGKLGRGVLQFTSQAIRKFTDLTSSVASFAAGLASRALTSGLRAAGQAVQQTTAGVTSAVSAFTSTHTNLTTGIEAEGAAHAQAARRIGVNYGYLGAQLRTFARQAGGMAMSLNISDELAGQAVRGFREAGSEFRAIGLTNANMVARFTSVVGVSGDLMRNSLLQARREFGFSDEDLRTLMHTTVAYGRASGDVTGALQNMPQILQQVRQQAVQAGLSLNPRQLAEQAAAVNRTATAFFAVSQNSEEARTMATQLSQSLLTSQRQMGDLFAGTAEDIPELAQGLGIATGDIQRSFQLMQSGPAGFTAGLAQMVQSARQRMGPRGVGMVLNQLRARLDQAVGPEQTNQLISFFGRASEEQLRTMSSSNRASEDLGAMARQGFSTGRTMQDAFERMQQSFISGFRGISRHAIGPFMRDTQHAFTEFNRTLHGVVERGGPLGSFVERLSLAHQIGATAFLPPDTRPFAMAMGTMFESVGPGLTALGSLGFRLSSLANPLVLIGAAVGFLALRFGALMMRTHNADRAFAQLQHGVEQFTTRAVTTIERLVPTLVRLIPSFIQALGRILQTLGPAILRIGAAIFEGLVNLGGQLLRWALHYDWGAFIHRVLTGVTQALSRAWHRIRETVSGAIQSAAHPARAAAPGATGAAGAGAPGGGGVAGVLQSLSQFSPVIATVTSAFRQLWTQTGGLQGLWQSFQRLMAQLVPIASALGTAIGQLIATLLPVLFQALRQLAATLGPVIVQFVQLAGNLLQQLIPVIGDLVRALSPVIEHLIRLVGDVLQQLLPVIGTLVSALIPVVSQLARLAGDVLSALLPLIGDLVRSLTPVITMLVRLAGDVLGALLPVIRQLVTSLTPVITQIVRLATTLVQMLIPIINQVVQALAPMIASIVRVAGLLLESLMPVFRSVIEALRPFMSVVMNLVGQALQPLLSIVRGVLSFLEPFMAIFRELVRVVMPPVMTILGLLGRAVLPILMSVFNELMAPIRALGEAIMWVVRHIPGRDLAQEVSTAAAAAQSRERERARDAQREVNARRRLMDIERLRAAGLSDDLHQTSADFIAQMAHAVRQGATISQARTFAYQQTRPAGAPAAPGTAGALDAVAQQSQSAEDRARQATDNIAAYSRRVTESLWRDTNLTQAQRQAQLQSYIDAQQAGIRRQAQQGQISIQQAAELSQTMMRTVEQARTEAQSVLGAAAQPEASRVALAVQRMTVRQAATTTGQLTQAATQAGQATTRIVEAAMSAEASLTRVQTVGIAAARAITESFDQTHARVIATFADIRGQGTGETGIFAQLRTAATDMFTHISEDATTATTSVITAFRENVTTLSHEISELFETVAVEAIGRAFTQGFNSVLLFYQNMFARRMMDVTTRMIVSIRDMFRQFLVAIVAATDAAFRFLEQRAMQMRTISQQALGAMQTIQAATQVAAATQQRTIDARAEHLGAREAGLNDVYNAIMHPDWYERDYKVLFVQKMDLLIQATQSSARIGGGGGAAGGRTAAGATTAINNLLNVRSGGYGTQLSDESGVSEAVPPPPVQSTRTAGAPRRH